MAFGTKDLKYLILGPSELQRSPKPLLKDPQVMETVMYLYLSISTSTSISIKESFKVKGTWDFPRHAQAGTPVDGGRAPAAPGLRLPSRGFGCRLATGCLQNAWASIYSLKIKTTGP